MEPSEYTANALKTEHDAEGYEKVKERLTPTDVAFLRDTLDNIATLCGTLDMLKKKIFYGSQKPEVLQHLSHVKTAMEVMNGGTMGELENKFTEIKDLRVLHSLIGIVGEAGELAEALIKKVDGEELDVVNVKEELGDIEWYKAIGLDALDLTFEQVWKTNNEKLAARYGEKFTEQAAVERNLEKERKVLEKKD